MHLEVQLAQSLGMTRTHMEDAIYALNIKTQLPPKSRSTLGGIFMVADGMGGHMYGDIASSIAIQTTAAQLQKTLVQPLHDGQTEFSDDAIQTILEDALQTAQNAVLDKVQGGGTTLTVALVLNKKLHFAHVGDSRLYITSATNPPLKALTLDHSLVQRLVELGQISQEDANDHPPNATYCLGHLGKMKAFGLISGMLKSQNHARYYFAQMDFGGARRPGNPVKAHQRWRKLRKMVNSLIEMANNAGGTDNISAILVKIS